MIIPEPTLNYPEGSRRLLILDLDINNMLITNHPKAGKSPRGCEGYQCFYRTKIVNKTCYFRKGWVRSDPQD